MSLNKPIRIYNNLVEACLDTLNQIFNEHSYTDIAIEKKLKSNKKWGARDRQFIAQTVYEIVRWQRYYRYLIGLDDFKNLSINDLRQLIAVYFIESNQYHHSHANLELFENIQVEAIKLEIEKFEQKLGANKSDELTAIRQSIPDWLADHLKRELGAVWSDEVDAQNRLAEMFIRTNTTLTNNDELLKQLALEHIDAIKVSPDEHGEYANTIKLAERKNIFRTKAFQNGMFEVQDANSQLVTPFLEIQEGMRCIDACAGAGGKTLHLATQMNNKGLVTALDIHAHKLVELKRRAKRNQLFNITAKLIDSNKVIKRLHDSADRLLIDAPCSGLGVLKRNPDSKWKLDLDFLEKVKQTQQQLLQNYAPMLKPEGIMVYATCSILPSENQKQVEIFLEQNQNYTLIDQKQLLASNSIGDGFYMAKIKRTH